MILSHPANKIENGHEGPYSVAVATQCHIGEPDVVVCSDMAGSHTSEECLERPEPVHKVADRDARLLVELNVVHDF